MLDPHRSILMVAVVCISTALLAITLLAEPAAAQDEAVLQKLPAEQVEQIKGVGRALLQAKRSYQPPEGMSQLRQDVKQLHALLEKLTRSTDGDSLQLETMTARTQSGQTPHDPWKEKHAGQVDQLLQLADQITEKSTLAAESNASQSAQTVAGPIFTPFSEPAFSRLEQLRSELDQALALPMAEWQTRLVQIKHQLRLSQQPVFQKANQPAETPTLINRTKHRPLGR